MKIVSLIEAHKYGCTYQLIDYVRDTDENRKMIQKFIDGVLDDILKKRKAIVVRNGGLISLYVNDVSEKETYQKYKSVK